MTLDTDILLFINGHHTEWLDTLMWTVSGKLTWLPLYVVVLTVVVWRYRRDWRTMLGIIIAFIVAVGGADYIVHTLKYVVCRPRPTHTDALEGMLHLVRDYRGGLFGFPSNHAADTAAFATMTGLWARTTFPDMVKNKVLYWVVGIVLVLYVVLNCYSRMYLGVHYPSDLAVGLLTGCGWAGMVYWVLRKVIHL